MINTHSKYTTNSFVWYYRQLPHAANHICIYVSNTFTIREQCDCMQFSKEMKNNVQH